MVTAIADAKLDSIPLIAITGQVPTKVIGSDAFQETPIVEVCRGITKHHYLVTDIKDVPRIIKEAFHIATTGRPIADKDLIREKVEWADEVYHLAAAVGVALIAKKPIETIERNIEPTQFLLSAVNEKHLSGRPIRLFLASTSEVYGKNPKKIWCEEDDLVFGPTTRDFSCASGYFFC